MTPQQAPSPGVTAVVPTHNRPQLMQRAVESIVAQEYDGVIEIIVVFDASEPFEPPVALPAGRTLQVVTNTRTRGLAGARNTGILAAGHEYVAFLDDDDWWLPEKLSVQMRRFAEQPEALLVGSAANFTDGEKVFPRPVTMAALTHDDLLRDRPAGLHSSTFVFRRDALLGGVGLVDEELPGSYGEDYDMLLRTAEHVPVQVVADHLVNVTWASGNSYFFGKWGAYGDGLTYLLERHPGFREHRASYAHLCSQIAFARATNGERAEARRWVRRALRRDPLSIKAWLALGISLRLLSGRRVAAMVQRLGKGI